MTDHRPPPPEPAGCLTLSRASSYKGGTLIAEHVHDLATHGRCITDPDAYRPDECPRCGGRVLHVHDYLQRTARCAFGFQQVITIVRHICAAPACGATWRILPAFLACQLWRVWPTVEQTASTPPPPPEAQAPIPRRTARRWHERLASTARQLVLQLATSGGALLETIARGAGLESTRSELVDIHARLTTTPEGRRLADLAALVHRLERGIRLM